VADAFLLQVSEVRAGKRHVYTLVPVAPADVLRRGLEHGLKNKSIVRLDEVTVVIPDYLDEGLGILSHQKQREVVMGYLKVAHSLRMDEAWGSESFTKARTS
jgi:hypothetical protein